MLNGVRRSALRGKARGSAAECFELVLNYLCWLGRHITIICNQSNRSENWVTTTDVFPVACTEFLLTFCSGKEQYDLRYTDLDNIFGVSDYV